MTWKTSGKIKKYMSISDDTDGKKQESSVENITKRRLAGLTGQELCTPPFWRGSWPLVPKVLPDVNRLLQYTTSSKTVSAQMFRAYLMVKVHLLYLKRLPAKADQH